MTVTAIVHAQEYFPAWIEPVLHVSVIWFLSSKSSESCWCRNRSGDMIPKAVVPKTVWLIFEIILKSLLENTDSQMIFQYILISRASMGPMYLNLLWKDETGEAIDREGKARSWSHLHDFGPDSGTVRSQWSVLSRGVEGWDFTTVERMYASRGDRWQEGQWPGCCCLQVRHDWPEGGCDGSWDGEKWLD